MMDLVQYTILILLFVQMKGGEPSDAPFIMDKLIGKPFSDAQSLIDQMETAWMEVQEEKKA